MIISYSNRAIFLHSRKTAGSSITAYLNHFLGPRDLQLGVWKESLAGGGRYNRKFYYDVLTSSCGMGVPLEWARAARNRRPASLADVQRRVYASRFEKPAHALAAEVKEFVGPKFDEFYKFCFVRNPFDRLLSDYRWRHKAQGFSKPTVSFTEFLERCVDPQRPDPEALRPVVPDNWPIYAIDGKVVADFVGRFENLAQDFEVICGEIGVPFDRAKFPHAKKTGGPKVSYRDAFSDYDRRLVETHFGHELDAFKYAF